MIPVFSFKADGTMKSLELDGNGKRIVTLSGDNNLRVWNSENGARLAGPFKHTNNVSSVKLASVSNTMVVFLENGTFEVWDVGLGR